MNMAMTIKKQEAIAMKEMQEQGKVNQSQTQGYVIEVRAPSSTSPPSPEGFRPLPLSQRYYKITGVPNSTISVQAISW